jgi:hypothetical protein
VLALDVFLHQSGVGFVDNLLMIGMFVLNQDGHGAL